MKLYVSLFILFVSKQNYFIVIVIVIHDLSFAVIIKNSFSSTVLMMLYQLDRSLKCNYDLNGNHFNPISVYIFRGNLFFMSK